MAELFPFVDETYRRRIELRPVPGGIDAEMEDYCHHFRVHLEHDRGVITSAQGTAVRFPWETCPVGAAGVRSLAGTALVDAVDSSGWARDRSEHCVHVVDLALLAVRHALDHAPTLYEALVVPGSRRQRQASLRQNGEPVLAWSLDGESVVGPERLVGLNLGRQPFFTWIRQHLPEAEHEPAVVLRRACYIGVSRGMDLDVYPTAGDVHGPDNSCFTYRAEVALTARRMRGSSRATEAGCAAG